HLVAVVAVTRTCRDQHGQLRRGNHRNPHVQTPCDPSRRSPVLNCPGLGHSPSLAPTGHRAKGPATVRVWPRLRSPIVTADKPAAMNVRTRPQHSDGRAVKEPPMPTTSPSPSTPGLHLFTR